MFTVRGAVVRNRATSTGANIRLGRRGGFGRTPTPNPANAWNVNFNNGNTNANNHTNDNHVRLLRSGA